MREVVLFLLGFFFLFSFFFYLLLYSQCLEQGLAHSRAQLVEWMNDREA